MQTYIINKLGSLAVLFLCIFLTLSYFGYGVLQWQAILIAVIIFGYGHFILGFYYQLRGFLRKPKPWQYFITFGILTLLSLILAHVLFEYLGFVAALFIGLVYFLFHGMLNEQTLVFRQTGINVPMPFFAAFAIFGITILTYSTPDVTFLFDRNMQFTTVNEVWFKYVFEMNFTSLKNFTYIFWGGAILSLITLAYARWKFGFSKLTTFLGLTFLSVAGLVIIFGAPAYIYAYLVVVGYHYMTWLLFYLVEMKRRGSVQYRNFIIKNIVILVPFIWAAYLFFQPYTPDIVYMLLDYNFFVIVGYIHISTSFMNETWFQNIQSWVFAKLTS